MRIIETTTMVDMTEDWSGVRSPSRAARRQKLGHRQNIVTRATPKKEAITMDGGATYYMHPELAKELRRFVKEQEPLGADFASPLANPWSLYSR